jgi:glutamyl-tRNA reductase
MNIIVTGLSHKTAPLPVRERLAFAKQDVCRALETLKQLPDVAEAALLSTCNRVEIYAAAKEAGAAAEEITGFLAAFHNVPAGEFRETLYIRRDEEAARQLFRVASSLDSMIPGEPQILGQVKDAFEAALSQKSTGFLLNRLFRKAISTAKRVRTETRIAENAVSISYAAVELAKKIFGGLTEKSVLLLGAGEMAELAARNLMNAGVRDIKVANRTHERGCRIAADVGGSAVKFGDIDLALAGSDILICSTNAPSYVITRELMAGVMRQRKSRPVFIVDISAPRNVDPGANSLDNVYLYNIDDLHQVVGSNIGERLREASRAEGIVDEEVACFSRWISSLDSAPVVIALRRKADEIKCEELARFRHRRPGLDEDTLAAVERLAEDITKKLVHDPSVALRGNDENRELMAHLARKIFGLDGTGDE